MLEGEGWGGSLCLGFLGFFGFFFVRGTDYILESFAML